MRSITVKVSDEQYQDLKNKANAARVSVSTVVRTSLSGSYEQDEGQLSDHERRISRLEEMAGL